MNYFKIDNVPGETYTQTIARVKGLVTFNDKKELWVIQNYVKLDGTLTGYDPLTGEELGIAQNLFDPQKLLTRQEQMLAGVEFEGQMISATKDDQFGLGTVENFVLAGSSINFHFDNGTIAHLTPENWGAMRAVWIPFRQSFFQ